MLTETRAKRIGPGDKPMADGTVAGLRLLPGSGKGRGKWQLRFVSPETGKRRDMGLGVYPDVSILSARERASEARKRIAEGVDPIEEAHRQQDEAACAVRVPTFQEAARLVFEDHKPSWSNGKHVDQWINTLTTYAFPVIGQRKVDTLKPADFADVLRPVWSVKAETARRVKQRCHAVMKWCWGREYVQGNPVDMVDMLLPKQSASARVAVHHPAMPWREVPQFVQEVVHAGEHVTRHLLEFTILTAARSGETRGMTWDEVDLSTATWIVPAHRMKTKVVHRVPLAGRAIELLEKRQALAKHPELVFPSLSGKVLTDMALTKFLRTHKAVSDVPGRVATAHGFRSSFRDWASENGVSRDVAERALAHTIRNAVEAAYHRTDLLEQRRSVMEAWAAYVMGSDAGGNVVALVGQE
ncbi:tyrosine-type recombinase/integrase [Marivita sp.]|uniref:tyrosine-type recombinase/integrase n=1 Tax=Marivita sp. TaxID=2003365 RepID=UPI003B5B5358